MFDPSVPSGLITVHNSLNIISALRRVLKGGDDLSTAFKASKNHTQRAPKILVEELVGVPSWLRW